VPSGWLPGRATRAFELGAATEEQEAGFGIRFVRVLISYPYENGPQGFRDRLYELGAVRAGWPAPTLTAWADFTAPDRGIEGLRRVVPAPGTWHSGRPAPTWLCNSGPSVLPRYSGARIFPRRVRFTGLAINTAFYGALVWLFARGPRTVLRYVRIRRGGCRVCGYPVGTSPVCTECGEPVKPRSAAPA
jgi:hypothetical protein